MPSYKVKQVIIIRSDLKMRKGKMIAQGAHASLNAYLKAPKTSQEEWMNTGHAKICVRVDTKDHLLSLYEQAASVLPCALIEDWGLTEFHGERHFTALAIGPAPANLIDPITRDLKLW